MKKYYLLWLFLVIYVIVFSYGLDVIPMIAMDEGWFAFYAYDEWGDNPYELTSTIQYKPFFLYPMLLGFWMKIWGISLVSIRSLAVVIGGIGVVGLYALLRRFTTHLGVIASTLTLFLMTNIVFVTFRWGRPEGMVTVALIWTLYCLVRGVQTSSEKWFLGVGLLLGTMVLLHPYSATVVMAVLMTLWRYPIAKKAYQWTIVGGGLVVSGIIIKSLVWDWIYIQQHFVVHIVDRLSVGEASRSMWDRLVYFWQSYTLGIKRVYILLFEIGVLLYGLIRYKKSMMISTLSQMGLLTFVLGLLCLDPFRRRYMGVVMVFSIVVAVVVLVRNQVRWKQWVTMFIAIYFMNNMAGSLYYVYKHHRNTPYSVITSQLQSVIPSQAKVLAPIHFWVALHPFYTMTEIHDVLRLEGFLDKSIESIDYMVFTPYFFSNVSPTTSEKSVGYDFTDAPFYRWLVRLSNTWELVHTLKVHPYQDIFVYRRP